MANIRLATIADLPGLADLFDAYRVYYHKSTDLAAAVAFLRERILQQDAVIFVAESDTELVGFTQLFSQLSSTRLSRFWVLNDLFVRNDFRGKGISKQLLDAAKNWARQTKALGLLLETEKTNAIGNQLYPSAGFQRYDDNNFYWWQEDK